MTHLNKLREAELFEVQRVRVSDGVVIVGKYDVGHLVLPVVVCHKGLVDGVANTIVITRGIRTSQPTHLYSSQRNVMRRYAAATKRNERAVWYVVLGVMA